MTNNILIEDQYKRTSLFEKENVNYLVRVLKRFNTVPKINNINIITSISEPTVFKIVPNKSIIIGASFLNQPVLALVYLRYGIEWQLWHKALSGEKKDTVLCDIAALEVTRIFYKLLPKDDPDYATIIPECEDTVRSMFTEAMQQEKQWAEYLFKDGSMIGLNAQLLSDYVEWITHKRLVAAGVKPDFSVPRANPLPWTQKWISGAEVQVAPQETEISSYVIGGTKKDVSDKSFEGFSL